MLKIVHVCKDDILFDPEAAGDMLTECLARKNILHLAGACETPSALIVSFEPAKTRAKTKIVIAPLEGEGEDDLSAEISQRYTSGFSLRSSFHAGERLWGLFEYIKQ